jgi:type I site-specific restriction endonuclease
MVQYCKGRKTVVFLPLIKTSQKMQEILQAKGFKVAEVNGQSKDREQVLQDFDAGKYDILCNSMLLTEGWDCPSVDCIVCLRPTKIRSLYCQIVGRGTRIHPGKDNLLLLDFLWHSDRHELCRPAHLIAGSQEVAKHMTKRLEENAGTDMDLEEVQEIASEDATHEREEALAKQLAEMKTRKRKLVDPLQFEMSILDKDLVNYQPALGWQSEQPSEKQKKQLEQSGIFPDEIDSAGRAEMLLDRINQRRNAGLATPKQIRFLEQKGFNHVGQWSFDSANKMIGRISANKWRVPVGINPKSYKPVEKTKAQNEYELFAAIT